MCTCVRVCVDKGNAQTLQQLLSVNAVGLNRDRLCHTCFFFLLFSVGGGGGRGEGSVSVLREQKARQGSG